MTGYLITFVVGAVLGVVLARSKKSRAFALKWGTYGFAVVGVLVVVVALFV